MTLVLQAALAEDLLADATRVGGLALSAGLLAAGIALLYRWYARERFPDGVSVLVGLSVVALFVNTTQAFQLVVTGEGAQILTIRAALSNTLAFVLAGAVAVAGGRVGDRVGTDVFAFVGARELDADVSQLVRAVGRVIVVDLPEDPADIDDIETYDPVAPETKKKLAGKTLVFPRGLTVEELRERLVDRLRTDYGVGYVDVDITESGGVEYLALGSRMAGIGPSLPPEHAAVAVRADPAFAASPGDVVQVWRPTPDADGGTGGFERLTTAEVRGTAGDVVTLADDAADIEQLSATSSYRLVTLPSAPRPDREFATLLRAALETMGVVTVSEGAALVGTTVGDLTAAVIAVRSAEDEVDPLPSRTRTLSVGDTVYAVGRPDVLRQLEARARRAESVGGPA